MGNNIEEATVGQGGRGTVEDLIAVIAGMLEQPPGGGGRAMALVIGDGGADHLGLLTSGDLSSGGLGLLASAITARAWPRASVLLEWACAGEPQWRYLGWSVERHAAQLSWRRLLAEELRTVIDPRTRRALGESPGVGFEE